VGFEVDEVALGQVFLRVLLFSPVSVIPQMLDFIFIYMLLLKKNKLAMPGNLQSCTHSDIGTFTEINFRFP
jgi:hypothetical protein